MDTEMDSSVSLPKNWLMSGWLGSALCCRLDLPACAKGVVAALAAYPEKGVRGVTLSPESVCYEHAPSRPYSSTVVNLVLAVKFVVEALARNSQFLLLRLPSAGEARPLGSKERWLLAWQHLERTSLWGTTGTLVSNWFQ